MIIKRFCSALLALLCVVSLYAQQTPPDSSSVAAGMLFRDSVSPYKAGKKKLPAWTSSTWAPWFNAADTYAHASLIATSSENHTVMFWVQREGLTAATTETHWVSWIGTHRSQLGYSTGGKLLAFYSGGITNDLATVYVRSTWKHVAISKAGASATIYVDGVFDASVSASSTEYLSGAMQIGRSYLGGNPISGRMAELAIFNTALSAADIQKYYLKKLKGTEPNLLHLWHLDDGPGALQFADSGPNNKPLGIYGGMKWAPRSTPYYNDIRDERYALYFDGVDDVATGVWNGAAATWPMTIEYWGYISSATTLYQTGAGVVYMPPTASTTNIRNGAFHWGTTAATDTFSGSSYITVGSAIQVTTNRPMVTGWHHLAWVVDSGSRTLYFDGQAVGSITGALDPRVSQINTIGIGMSQFVSGTWNFCKGKMASVRIWDTARTQQQIRDNMYTTLVGNEAGLRHYYKINEGSGTVLYDSVSSGGSNLTCYAGPTWVGRGLTRDYETNPKSDLFCPSYDGVDDYSSASVASSDWGLGNPNGFSIGCWAQLSSDTSSTAFKSLVSLRSITPAFVFSTFYRQGEKTIGLQMRNVGISYSMPASWTVGDWHHVAATSYLTATGSFGNLWLDGVLVASGKNAYASASFSVEQIQVGTAVGLAVWQGKIADAFVYKRILSQSEIQSLMTTRPADYSDNTLVGYWPLNEGGRMNISFDYSVSSLGGVYYQNLIHTNGPTWATRSIP